MLSASLSAFASPVTLRFCRSKMITLPCGIDRNVVEILASAPLRRAEAIFLQQVIAGRSRHQPESTQRDHEHATCSTPNTIRLHANPPLRLEAVQFDTLAPRRRRKLSRRV